MERSTHGRLPFPELVDVPERASRQVGRFPLNLTRMFLHIPDAVEPYINLAFALLKHGRLAPKVRELVILRVACLSGSSYELTQHLPAARKAGATEAEIASAESGHPAGLDPRLALAFRFAEGSRQGRQGLVRDRPRGAGRVLAARDRRVDAPRRLLHDDRPIPGDAGG